MFLRTSCVSSNPRATGRTRRYTNFSYLSLEMSLYLLYNNISSSLHLSCVSSNRALEEHAGIHIIMCISHISYISLSCTTQLACIFLFPFPQIPSSDIPFPLLLISSSPPIPARKMCFLFSQLAIYSYFPSIPISSRIKLQ